MKNQANGGQAFYLAIATLFVGGALTSVFIVLKISGLVGWLWLWVLSPLWIGFSLMFAAVFGGFMGLWVYNFWKAFRNLQRGRIK